MAPRAGLTADRIVDAAEQLVDQQGFAALTLGGVAAALGVRTPSLYNHVDGLEEVRRRLTVRGIRRLGETLQRATVGRSRDDAVRALVAAHRAFGHAHPGLYATTVPASEVDDDEVRAAGAAVVETILAVLAGYDLGRDDAIHATRSLRAAVHGFVSLELSGGFGLDQDPEDSFAWLADVLVRGIRGRATAAAG